MKQPAAAVAAVAAKQMQAEVNQILTSTDMEAMHLSMYLSATPAH
jgi:hypothetical protein